MFSPASKPEPHMKFYCGSVQNNGMKVKEDAYGVRASLQTKCFASYEAYFSLAGTTYAGAAILLNIEQQKESKLVRSNFEHRRIQRVFHIGHLGAEQRFAG